MAALTHRERLQSVIQKISTPTTNSHPIIPLSEEEKVKIYSKTGTPLNVFIVIIRNPSVDESESDSGNHAFCIKLGHTRNNCTYDLLVELGHTRNNCTYDLLVELGYTRNNCTYDLLVELGRRSYVQLFRV
jgi:hypothetical protein